MFFCCSIFVNVLFGAVHTTAYEVWGYLLVGAPVPASCCPCFAQWPSENAGDSPPAALSSPSLVLLPASHKSLWVVEAKFNALSLCANREISLEGLCHELRTGYLSK
eukprot:3118575-Rhodomonas_salina.1